MRGTPLEAPRPSSLSRRGTLFACLVASFLVGLATTAPASPVSSAPPPTTTAPSTAEPPSPLLFARVYVDGVRPPTPRPAVVADGHLYGPARALFEKLGAIVAWGPPGQVTIEFGNRKMRLWLGRPEAEVDGLTVWLEAEPFLWKSTVMVPVRFVAECMGLTVTWDQERRAVFLDHGSGGQGDGAGGLPARPIRQVTLAFAGDTLLGFRIGEIIQAKGVHYPWGEVAPVLSAADIAMVNLECSVSARGSPMPGKLWTFRAAPEALEGLRDAGVDVVSTANNHILDYGTEAFLDTLDYLDQYGVARVGSGADQAEALRPAIIEAGGFSIGFLGATQIYPVNEWVATSSRPGVFPTHYETAFLRAVADLKKQVDFVVVGVHWGVERDRFPSEYQKRYGRALADAGADLVIGHHPHVLQGMEVYKGRLVAFSLGNFVFTYTTRATQDTGILVVTLDDQGLAAAQFLPGYTGTSGRPTLEEDKDRDRILAEMTDFSREWGTEFDPTGYLRLP